MNGRRFRRCVIASGLCLESRALFVTITAKTGDANNGTDVKWLLRRFDRNERSSRDHPVRRRGNAGNVINGRATQNSVAMHLATCRIYGLLKVDKLQTTQYQKGIVHGSGICEVCLFETSDYALLFQLNPNID